MSDQPALTDDTIPAPDADFERPNQNPDLIGAGENLRQRAKHIENAEASAAEAREAGELEGEILAEDFDMAAFLKELDSDVENNEAIEDLGSRMQKIRREGLDAETQSKFDDIVNNFRMPDENKPTIQPEAQPPAAQGEPAADAPTGTPPQTQTPATEQTVEQQTEEVVKQRIEAREAELRAEFDEKHASLETKMQEVQTQLDSVTHQRDELKADRDKLKEEKREREFLDFAKTYGLRDEFAKYAWQEAKSYATRENREMSGLECVQFLQKATPQFFADVDNTGGGAPAPRSPITPKAGKQGTGSASGGDAGSPQPEKKASTFDEAKKNIKRRLEGSSFNA